MKVIQYYTLTLNFVNKKHRQFKNLSIYKAKKIIMTQKLSKKILHILGNGTSGVQVADIEQVVVKKII